MPKTSRLNIPLLATGQAQKELTHNEALAALDLLVQAACISGPSNQPPDPPTLGATYIVGTAPTGSWAGHAGALAAWTLSGWRFAAPVEGCAAVGLPDGIEWRYLSGNWSRGVINSAEVRVEGQTVLRSRQPAIPAPSGGPVADAEARSAIVAILSCLRNHGLIAS